MFKVLKLYFFSFFFFLLPPLLQADPVDSSANTTAARAPLGLPEVVVTANRLDTPVSQVTDSMTVLTAKDLERKQAGTVMEGLQGIPGLDMVQSGPSGQNTSLYLRGTSPQQTLVLMDGIPLNDPVGTPFSYDYLDGFSLGDIQQVEVVRGPQSTLWGSNAIGGVINIVPKSGPGPWGGSALVEGGSYGTSKEMVSAQGGDNGGYFNLNLSHFNTAGFPILDVKGLDAADAALEPANAGSVSNGDDNNTASLRLGSNLASNLEEKVLVRYGQTNTSFDAYGSSFVLADDPGYFGLQKQFMADSHTDWKILEGSWEQTLTLSFFDDDRTYAATANPYNTYYANGFYDGQTAQVNWQNNLRLAKEETVVLGLQGQEQWASTAYANGYTDLGAFPTDAEPVTSVRTGSGFVESLTSLEGRLFFNLSGRWEDHSQYGVHTTYQAGLAYFVPELETQLKANYGTGFVAPSLYQLYDPNYGNPQLLPETSLGYDLGFEQSIGGLEGLKLGADYFDNDLSNLIFYNAQFVSENIGKARTYGAEAYLEFKAIPNLDVKGSYTYTNARDLVADKPLILRPQDKASGDLDYQWGKVGLGASLVYVGDSFDQDFGNNYVNGSFVPLTVILPGYFLVNLRASFQVNDQVRLFARVNNLFNQWYEENYGYRTPGLSAYGGTQVSF